MSIEIKFLKKGCFSDILPEWDDGCWLDIFHFAKVDDKTKDCPFLLSFSLLWDRKFQSVIFSLLINDKTFLIFLGKTDYKRRVFIGNLEIKEN